jgi:hypothetical protein
VTGTVAGRPNAAASSTKLAASAVQLRHDDVDDRHALSLTPPSRRNNDIAYQRDRHLG